MRPSLTERGATPDEHKAGRRKPAWQSAFPAKVWSVYGARRAQPAATSRSWAVFTPPVNHDAPSGAAFAALDFHGACQTIPWQFQEPVNLAPVVTLEVNVPLEGMLPLTLIRLSPPRRSFPP
jgi:hypothetical protein